MSGAISIQGTTGASVRAVSMRTLFPQVGVWLAELELDPVLIALAPSSGKVTITVGEPTPLFTLSGTIDPRGSGAFVGVPKLRVLGGGAGWDQIVKPQDFQSDGGVLSTRVYSTTALQVGEVVNVLVPAPLGTHFVRSAGPASRVLDGEPSWWVDTAGVTQVGPRPPAAQDASLTVLRWLPDESVVELTCDVLVMPGTVLVDPRLPAGLVVRDVEQRFDAQGSAVTAWCGAASVSQLMGDLRQLVEAFSGRATLKTYRYRVVSQNSADGRLSLQAVHKTVGMPDVLPVVPWAGMQGDSAKFLPGSIVRVAFLEGDPTLPVADSYSPGLPVERTVDAKAAVHLGPSAARVELAGGQTPLALAPAFEQVVAALTTFATGLSPTTLVAQAGALVTALGGLPPAATTKVTAE